MDEFKTPLNKKPVLRTSTAVKRDSLAAELERDPHLSTSKRAHRSALLTSSLSHSSLERQLLTLQTTKIDLDTKLREKELAVERLERDRAYFADLESEARRGWEEEREGREGEKLKFNSEIRNLRNALSTLQNEHDELSDTHSSHIHTCTQTINTLKSQMATLKSTLSLTQSQLEQSDLLSETRLEALTKLQNAHEDVVCRVEEQEREGREEGGMRVVREEMIRQGEYLRNVEVRNRKLEGEVRVLREREGVVEVLREEKREMERKVRGVEELRREVEELRREVGERRREVEVLREKEREGGRHEPMKPSDTPIAYTQSLSQLRLEHAKLLDTHGTTLAELKTTKGRLEEVQRSLGVVREERERVVGVLEREVGVLRREEERGGRERGVWERERGFLRALVASYESEYTLNETLDDGMRVDGNGGGGADGDDKSNTTLLNHHEISRQRILHLEGLVEEYRGVVEELRGELEGLERERMGAGGAGGGGGGANGAGGANGGVGVDDERVGGGGEGEGRQGRQEDRIKIEKLEADIMELKNEKEEVEEVLTKTLEELDKAEQTLFELQGEVAGGRHVPPGVKILSLKDNPEEEWFKSRKEVIDRLKGENEALMNKLKELEERAKAAYDPNNPNNNDPNNNPNNNNSNNNNSFIPPESYSSLQSELTSLQSLLAQKDKRLMRLQEIFKSKSAEFRDAIASILGVKLAFYPNGGVRVTSVFDLYASFVFQPSGGVNDEEGTRTMQLIAQSESGPEELKDTMEYWIGKEQCIPGFMASVTLESWEKKRRGEV